MKNILLATAALTAMIAGSAAAQDLSVTGNIAVTSDYVWRGASQTAGNGAIQGGIDLAKGNLYGGIWASNVDFGTNDDTEVDLYVGIKPTIGSFSYDFGLITYWYNGDTDVTTELKGAVSHPIGKGTIGGAIFANADTLEDPYYEINASYPLTEKFSVSGAIGNCEGGNCNGLGNYVTYNIGTTYALTSKIGLDVRYSDLSKPAKNATAKGVTFVTLKANF